MIFLLFHPLKSNKSDSFFKKENYENNKLTLYTKTCKLRQSQNHD